MIMVSRTRLESPKRSKKKKAKRATKEKENSYFTSTKSNLEFVSAGSANIDCILGGGMALGRMTNVIGDKSTAKTHLACETIANFISKYGPEGGKAKYREIEAAFDQDYARAMNIPVDDIDFGNDEGIITVEGFHKDLEGFLDDCIKENVPGVYILDSFDALSDEAEMNRDIGKDSYGGSKQKKAGELFRKLIRKLERSRVLLVIISQVRDNIGVAFGEKHRRAGGKALDFYASQFLWLAHIKTLKKTIKGVERPYGIEVRAKCKKNKIGFPFRETDFTFIFGFGVDDVVSNIRVLEKINRIEDIGVKKSNVKKFIDELNAMDDEDYEKQRKKISKTLTKAWYDIEETFLPKRKKKY